MLFSKQTLAWRRGMVLAVGAVLVSVMFWAVGLRADYRYPTSYPQAAATATNPMVYPVIVPDPANPGKNKVVLATINNLAAYNPNTETITQASVRKANAIAAAVNAVLPGTATVTQEPSWFLHPFPIGWKQDGPIQGVVTIKGAVGLGGARQGGKDPTREPGGGGGVVPGNGNPPPPSKSSGGYGGSGQKQGNASGVDPTGAQSVIYFGFYQDNGSSADIATVNPTAGETDSQVLTSLGAAFNSAYSAGGYSATYDPTTDTLSLDQPLTPSDALFAAGTDTGLNFFPSVVPTPEPAVVLWLILGLGVWTLLARRRV